MTAGARRFMGGLWLAVAALAILFLAAETWYAAGESRVRAAAAVYRRAHASVYDAQPVWETVPDSLWLEPYVSYRPGASIEQTVAGEPVRVRINSRGFRTHEFEVPRPAAVLRVVCLGGSTTVQGPTNEKTYPALLEQALRRRLGADVEVLNLGISGVASDHWLARVEALFALEPDVVVQYEGVNDLAWRALPAYGAAHPWRTWLRGLRALRPLLPVRLDEMRGLLERAVANQERMRALCRKRGVAHLAATFAAPDYARASPDFQAYLDENVRTEWGVHAHLSTFAEYRRLLDGYNDLLSGAAGRGSLTVVRVAEDLRDTKSFKDACHLTGAGIGQLSAAFEEPVAAAVALLAARRRQDPVADE